jgi:hypothetical protein
VVAATAIQAAWRSACAQAQFRRLQAAAVVLQSAWRGASVRSAISASHGVAVLLQSCARVSGWALPGQPMRRTPAAHDFGNVDWLELAHKHGKASCNTPAPCRMQGARDRRAFLASRGAAIQLQAAARGWIARRR